MTRIPALRRPAGQLPQRRPWAATTRLAALLLLAAWLTSPGCGQVDDAGDEPGVEADTGQLDAGLADAAIADATPAGDAGGGATVPDAAVTAVGLLCTPCNDDAFCAGAGGVAGALCVDQGPAEGAFCGIPCSAEADCPGGYACVEVTGKAGNKASQCVRGANAEGKVVCPCSPAAIAAKASTHCQIGTGSTNCVGQRTCTPQGLSACVPPKDVCNGLDDDCDGATDEGFCDDGDPCTLNDVCTGGKCVPSGEAMDAVCGCSSNADCAAQEDGDPCNGTLYCDKAVFPFQCKINPATVISCTGAGLSPCHKAVCQPATGKCVTEQLAPGEVCSDGNACTQAACDLAGKCTVTDNLCGCESSADCPTYVDDNPCKGKFYCDKSTQPHQCKPNPGTVVTCPATTQACKVASCDPKSGGCKLEQAPDGTLCDDGDGCTANDSCAAGVCAPGVKVCICTGDADCAKFDDADQCNGNFYCDLATHTCKPNLASVVVCSTAEDSQCTANKCDPGSGKCKMGVLNEGFGCDDGNPCTAGETCAAGQCVATSQSNVCGCQKDADCAAKEDGDVCNGTLFCNKQLGKCELNLASMVSCASVGDLPCVKNTCDPSSGKCKMKNLPDDALCSDGNKCTANDTCQAGVCVGGKKTCLCQVDADCAEFDDGDLCNGSVYCDMTGSEPVCKQNPATIVVCDVENDDLCLKNLCKPATGKCALTPLPDGTQCEDGIPCTDDQCINGKCGTVKDLCTDGNPCTIDWCDLETGKCGHKEKACPSKPCTTVVCDEGSGACVYSTSQEGCDDGDPCTVKDLCKDQKCTPGEPMVCDDGNPCTLGKCSQANGACVYTPTLAECEDGDMCTFKDVCQGGVCKGLPVDYDDKNPCTLDSCLPLEGPKHDPSSLVGQACEDDNICTAPQGKCNAKGDCVASPVVCDKKECHTGTCVVEQGGCVYQSEVDGEACTTDDDQCTTEKCVSGVCKLADTKTCDSPDDPCNTATCDPTSGQCGPKSPGNEDAVCVPKTGCSNKGHCKVGVCVTDPGTDPCDDGNPCTSNDCDDNGKCTPLNLDIDCDDGDPCTKSSKCSGGQCGTPELMDAGTACDTKDPCTVGNCKWVKEPPLGKEVLKCVPKPKCDDKNACTLDSCHPKTGVCKFEPLKTCDDGDPCTENDACVLGQVPNPLGGTTKGYVCKGVKKNCDDGNSCAIRTCEGGECALTGTLSNGAPCNTSDPCNPGVCAPLTPPMGKIDVVCKAAAKCTGNDPCRLVQCDAKTGDCAYPKVAVGTKCSDGKLCTIEDHCADWTLKNGLTLWKCSGKLNPCDDGTSCTNDSCDTALDVCKNVLEGGCSDGNACTTGDKCVLSKPLGKYVCQGTPTVCAPKACHTVACDAADGQCKYTKVASGTTCDDGQFCTVNDQCKLWMFKGSLQWGCGGAPNPCDDGNPCVDRACNEVTDKCDLTIVYDGLTHKKPDCSTKPCTPSACFKGQCKEEPACEDNNPCTKPSCGKDGKCVFTNLSLQGCPSGNACYSSYLCKGGKPGDSASTPGWLPATCQPDDKFKDPCNDNNACTSDLCDTALGKCTHKAVTPPLGQKYAPCNDGNACSAGDWCEGSSCVGHNWKGCDDGNACTNDSCNPKTGACAHVPNSNACSDGNACTLNDVCVNGGCKPGPQKSCPDGTCTVGYCSGGGCLQKPRPNGWLCSDGNACTKNDICLSGACKGAAVTCDDNNVCTDNACNPKSGCYYPHNSIPCFDNNKCTTNDKCTSGACKGTPVTCNDNNVCTNDACVPSLGCLFAANTAACSDGNPCTVNDTCSNKSCKPGAPYSCTTSNPCQTSSCIKNPAMPWLPLCKTANKPNGTSCNDGSACTNYDKCASGTCKGTYLCKKGQKCNPKYGCY